MNTRVTKQQRRVAVGAALAFVLVAVWLAAGVRHVGDDEFAVVDGTLLPPEGRTVAGSWALAPPGLRRIAIYPRRGVELALPGAESARIAGPGGVRYGLRGWVTLRARPEAWSRVHEAAAGGGLEELLVAAVREACADIDPLRGRAVPPRVSERIERALGGSLLERGVDLRRLDLDSFDFLAAQAGAGRGGDDARLLVVGLDGADWEILDPLLAAGRLPNLQRLIDDGTRARLLSIRPLLSPVVWTSAATGVEPRRHGILDFLVAAPDGGGRQPVTSVQRRVPTFWELVSGSGVDVGVVGWWATWPADPVRGYLVSDRIAYQLFGYRADPADARGKTWPPELYDDVRSKIVTPDAIGWDRVQPFLDGERMRPEEFDDDERKLLDEFRTLLASGESYVAIDLALRERMRPALEVVYLEGTDTVGHLFMPYRAPRLPDVSEERFASFRSMVDRYYETADALLGRLLEGKGESWTVMLLSDHGFATDTTRPRSTDSRIGHGAAADWHRRFGVLILSGANVRSGVRLDEAGIYDVAPTVLALFGQPVPRSWPGRVLADALTDEFLERHPVRFRTDDPVRDERSRHSVADPQAADLLEKLQSLGYVSTGPGGEGDAATASNNAGVALLSEGKFAEAETTFRRGLETQPGSPMLSVNLGLALALQGRRADAVRRFEEAYANPLSRRMAGHQLAMIRLDEGDLDEAQRLVTGLLETEPEAAELRNTLGRVLEQRGDPTAATREYLRAVDGDPDAALPRNNLGNLARARGERDEAETWYREAIEADPYFMGAYNNLALVYQEQGNIDRAIDLYDRALGKAPGHVVVLNNLASLHYATGELDEARRIWERTSEAQPDYASPWNNLAGLEIRRGRLDEADRLLDRALELDPGYGDAHINRAILLNTRGRIDDARAELKLATEDPRCGSNAWVQLGLFELDRGRFDDARSALERAREVAPHEPRVLNALGEAHWRAGRKDRARDLWRRSLELAPDQPDVRRMVEQPVGS
ncbi:MAG: tetratricopeptide repeat protein [bacterium]|nr:tetratricopeptide repeat protein [bacterium]